MKKTKVLVLMGLLIALDVIASCYLTIKTPIVKIGFSFIPISFTGIVFGPVLGAFGAMASDLLQYILFPAGAYIPGLTLTSGLAGLIYGVFLFGKKPTIWRTLIPVSINRIVVSIFINSFILYLAMPGQTYLAFVIARAPQNLILIPIQTFAIYAVFETAFRTKLIQNIGFNSDFKLHAHR